MTLSAVMKADEPKVAARAARLLGKELLRELEQNGLNPELYEVDVSMTVRRRAGRGLVASQSVAQVEPDPPPGSVATCSVIGEGIPTI